MDQHLISVKGLLQLQMTSKFMAMIPTMILHLHEAMERTGQAGLKLNYDKCVIKTKSCTFFGNVYTPQGSDARS